MVEVSIEVFIWFMNFLWIYMLIYKQGHELPAGLLMTANSIMVSTFLESNVAVLTIFLGVLIGILMSMNTLRDIAEEMGS